MPIQLNRCLQPGVESYVEQGSTLYCEVLSACDLEEVTVTYRFVDMLSGRVVVDTKMQSIALGNGETFTVKANLPECFLVSLSVSCAYADQRGETYVRVKLKNRGALYTTTFLRGYITVSESLTYPPVFLQDSLSGLGAEQKKSADAPLPYLFTVPYKRLWRVRSIDFGYTASAAEADRLAYLEIRDALGNAVRQIQARELLTAGQVGRFKFSSGVDSRTVTLPGATDTVYITTAIGELLLPGGYQCRVDVADADGSDAADATAYMMCEELLLPDLEIPV